jgi:O-antigen/teichoic acid export membrane protein
MRNFATTVMQVVGFAFIARLITTSGMGLLAILSLMLGLAQLITPPLPAAVTRFAAEELAQGHRQKAAAVVYQSTKVDLTLSAAVAAAYFLLASWLSRAFSTEPIVFQIFAVDVFLGAGLTGTLSNGLIGAQRFRDYSVINTTFIAVRQVLMVGLLLLFHRFFWLVFAWVISDLLYLLMMVVAIIRVLGPPSFGFSLTRLLRFSLPLLPGNAIGFVYDWYDRALVLPYASLAALGVYNGTLTAFAVLSAIPGGMDTALYPAYAEIRTTKGKAGLQDAIRAASRYVSFVATPLALGLFATAKPALALFVGEPYESGSIALQILSLFFALTVLYVAFQSIFLLLGKTATASATTAVSVSVSFVMALLLLPSFGINGAAASRAVGMVVSFVLTFAIASRDIRLSFDREALWKSFAAGIAMVIVVWLAQMVSYSRLLLPAYAMLGACTYLAGLRLLRAVHRVDVELASQVLGQRYQMPVRALSKILETPG